MKIAALMVVAAALLPLSAKADGPVKVSDFPLAERIKEKVASGKPLDIYVSYHDVSNEFAPAIKAGVVKGAADDKVNAQFIGPVGSDANAQINEIETLMGKMDGLAISSVSSDALGPVIDRVLKAGIPVVTYNTDNPNSKRLAFAGQDLVQSGREAGKLMGKVLEGKGKVMITTIDAAAQWSLDREKGVREALKTFPGIEVVKTLNTGSDPQKIYSEIENAMLADPSVTGILSLECCSTPAAGTWVQRNKKTGVIKVVGFDFSIRRCNSSRAAIFRPRSTRRPRSRVLRPWTCSCSSCMANRSKASIPASASTPRRTSTRSPRSRRPRGRSQ